MSIQDKIERSAVEARRCWVPEKKRGSSLVDDVIRRLHRRNEWEKIFHKMVEDEWNDEEWVLMDLDGRKKLMSFIQELLSTREKEIAEEVEKKSFRGSAPYEQHYLIKKVDVLSILKYK